MMNAYESVAKIVEKVENIYRFIHSPLTVEAFFHFSSFPMSRNRARRKKIVKIEQTCGKSKRVETAIKRQEG